MDKNNLKSRLESLLFVSGKPIGYKKLAGILKIEKTQEVADLLNELNAEYQSNQRGFRIVFKSDSAQLASAPENADSVQKLVTSELQDDLSKAALETLAIIAYRGPISRSEIEMIRGVNCIYILRSLLIRGLITKKSSQEDLRLSVYEASMDLLKHLGLSSVKDMPNYDQLREQIKFEAPQEEEKKFKAVINSAE